MAELEGSAPEARSRSSCRILPLAPERPPPAVRNSTPSSSFEGPRKSAAEAQPIRRPPSWPPRPRGAPGRPLSGAERRGFESPLLHQSLSAQEALLTSIRRLGSATSGFRKPAWWQPSSAEGSSSSLAASPGSSRTTGSSSSDPRSPSRRLRTCSRSRLDESSEGRDPLGEDDRDERGAERPESLTNTASAGGWEPPRDRNQRTERRGLGVEPLQHAPVHLGRGRASGSPSQADADRRRTDRLKPGRRRASRIRSLAPPFHHGRSAQSLSSTIRSRTDVRLERSVLATFDRFHRGSKSRRAAARAPSSMSSIRSACTALLSGTLMAIVGS